MTVGSASFYRLRGSFSSGEYPLLATGQDLSAYRLNQATVKYAAGLQTEVTVPMFTGYQDVNVIELDGSYYWATAWRESTTYNGSVTYTCDYMAPTSLIKSGQTINAYLDRSPSYITKYLSDDWTKGRLVLTDPQQIGHKMVDSSNNPMYWIQITGVDTNGNLKRYGLFASVPIQDDYSEPYIYTQLPALQTGGTVGYYPSIYEVMSNIASFTPFTASTVKDISITVRAPYDYFIKVVQSGTFTYRCPVLGDSSQSVTYIAASKNGSGDLLTYDLGAIMNDASFKQIVQTTTFDDDDMLRLTGNILIRDYNMNIVGSFPVSEGLTLNVQTYCDYSGIYTIISNGYRRLTVPEGHLPWAGSAWDEYRAYQLAGDRQAMDNAIGYAERERYNTALAGLGEGVVSGAITGAFAGSVGGPIGAGIGLITGGISSIATTIGANTAYDIEVGKLRDEQALLELRAKTSAGSGYSVAYGLIYVALTAIEFDLCAGAESPIDVSDDVLTAYVDRVGYPCEGLQQIAAVPGFYKGFIPVGLLGQGMFYNELNRIMRQGFKFIGLEPPAPNAVILSDLTDDYVSWIDGTSNNYQMSDFDILTADGQQYVSTFDHDTSLFGPTWLASRPYITFTTSEDLPSSDGVVGLTIFTGTAAKDANGNYGYLIMKDKVYAYTTAPNYMHEVTSTVLADAIKSVVHLSPYNETLTDALMTRTFDITEVRE